MEGLKKYGEKGIKEIADYIKTRNPAQVRSHLQKYKLKNPLPKFIAPESNIQDKNKDIIISDIKTLGNKITKKTKTNEENKREDQEIQEKITNPK